MIAAAGMVASVIAALAAGATHAVQPGGDAPVPKRYALIVANSRSLTPGVRPLEYADDDAARWAELFDPIADELQLLVVLDADIQRVYPAQAARAKKPDRATLLAALQSIYAHIDEDTRAGRGTVFYFVMIGHGEMGPGGEGFVSLLDAPFTRSDLYREVLARSPATTNHVIIDACNSYFLVNRRGGGGDDDSGPSRAEAVREYVGEQTLARYPNTGVLLSTSSAKESHEWSGFSAGVFSHELRSALTGAADANGDGLVDYSEAHAFIAAANLRVDDPRARVEMFAAPPALDVRQPIVDLRRARFQSFLSVPAGKPLRFYLEDDRGVRYADVNLTGEVEAYVALLSRGHYWVRTADDRLEQRIEGRSVRLDPAQLRPASIAARGSLGDVFQTQLFDEPYGPLFHRGFAAAHGYATQQAPAVVWEPLVSSAEVGTPPEKIAGWIAIGGGALLAGGALWAGLAANDARADFDRHVDASGNVTGITRAEAEDLESRAKAYAWARNGLAVGSVLAIAGGAILVFALGDEEAGAGVAPSGDGAVVGLWGRF